MVKKAEILEVWRGAGRFHAALMLYTAVMVPATDFLTAVLTALGIYVVFGRFFDKKSEPAQQTPGDSDIQAAAE